jgi:hypothetical protein
MARKVKIGVSLGSGSKDKVVDGTGLLAVLRIRLRLNHRLAGRTSGVTEACVEGSQLKYDVDAVGHAEALLRRPLMLQ